ncbi:MAG: tetratricopeptide repeat protein [Candidatus Obscuribacterales bacterium]|nr:tetratricopeptide repeat protein [Candidatus Obscuribacterales bacterium]
MSTSVNCHKPGCAGNVEHGICSVCGQPAHLHSNDVEDLNTRDEVLTSLRELLTGREARPTREELKEAADRLSLVAPYNFQSWRLHADLLLNALNQLLTRQLEADTSFKILTIPLREEDLRNAAEAALRQCAHFADSAEKRIALVDEANSVRRKTWF